MIKRNITSKRPKHQSSRAELNKAVTSAIAKAENSMISRQVDTEEDVFTTEVVKRANILVPPYDPFRMSSVCESNSILPQCIDAMVRNIDGFGYELQFIGDSENEDSPEAEAEKARLSGFLNRVNETQSFMSVRKQVREDIETMGYGFFEAVRSADGEISLLYWMDAKYTRLQAKQKDPVEITVDLIRGGKTIPVKIKKRFRRYAMYTSALQGKIRFFKEYGDPRKMDAITGLYEGDKGAVITEEATEVIHVKLGNNTYGIPRWAGHTATVLGTTSADYVNYDLFENQVVPPLAIMVSGGKLTSESVDDIAEILIKKRGVKNFNKVLILEAQSEGNVDDRDRTKVEMKELSQARKEDSMFNEYLKLSDTRVRSAFRIPEMFVGRSESYSKSTADSSKMVGEEQVFVPERADFDEMVNITIMGDLKAKYWRFKSKGPRLISGEDIILAVEAFAKIGALTINDTIKIANNLLGRDITEYTQEWAKYPIPIILELAKQGSLDDIDEVISMTAITNNALNNAGSEVETEEQLNQKAAITVALKTLRKALVNRRIEDKTSKLI